MNFDFVLPSSIRYGKGIVSELDRELNKLSAKKIMIVCDKGIIKAGILEQILSLLDNEQDIVIFDEVEANPSD